MRGHPWRVGQGQACPSGRGAGGGDQEQRGLAREERRERPRGPLLLGWGELSRARELGMGGTLWPGCLQPSAPHSGAQSPAVSNSSVAAVACGPCVQEGPSLSHVLDPTWVAGWLRAPWDIWGIFLLARHP